MTPIEIACRHIGCDAQSGQQCFTPKWMHQFTHSERLEDAAAMTTGEGEPTKEDFDSAINESGLV